MTGGFCVFSSVTIWRAVATACAAALLARAQVNPLRTDLHAVFADAFLRMFDVGDGVDMNTYFCRHD